MKYILAIILAIAAIGTSNATECCGEAHPCALGGLNCLPIVVTEYLASISSECHTADCVWLLTDQRCGIKLIGNGVCGAQRALPDAQNCP